MGDQEPSTWDMFHCFSTCISRELDCKAWTPTNTNMGVGSRLTLCTTVPVHPFLTFECSRFILSIRFANSSVLYNWVVAVCLLGMFQMLIGEATVLWNVVSESFLYPCAGGEVERQIPANEVLRVAPDVSRD